MDVNKYMQVIKSRSQLYASRTLGVLALNAKKVLQGDPYTLHEGLGTWVFNKRFDTGLIRI